jgi:hypothetical protein
MASPHTWLAILSQLLASLPDTIPYNPHISQYDFTINMAEIDEDGVYCLANWCLKVSFQTHISPNFKILKRGDQLKNLMSLLEYVLKMLPPSKHRFFCKVWIEWLIKAAKASGAVLLDMQSAPLSNTISLPSGSWIQPLCPHSSHISRHIPICIKRSKAKLDAFLGSMQSQPTI